MTTGEPPLYRPLGSPCMCWAQHAETVKCPYGFIYVWKTMQELTWDNGL
jgi:hypothetical protein